MDTSLFSDTMSPENNASLRGISKWSRILGIVYLTGSCLFILFVLFGMAASRGLSNAIDYEGIIATFFVVVLYMPAAFRLLRSAAELRRWNSGGGVPDLESGLAALKRALQWAGGVSLLLIVLLFLALGYVAVIDFTG